MEIEEAKHPSTPSDGIVVDRRRRAVAALKLRGLTLQEIADALALQGQFNPNNKKPWSKETISNDVIAIKKEWRAEAATDIATATTAILAELREVRRKAWQDNHTKTVLQSIKQECQLLGLDSPVKIAPADGSDVFKVQLAGLTNEQLRGISGLFDLDAGYAAGSDPAPEGDSEAGTDAEHPARVDGDGAAGALPA